MKNLEPIPLTNWPSYTYYNDLDNLVLEEFTRSWKSESVGPFSEVERSNLLDFSNPFIMIAMCSIDFWLHEIPQDNG